MQKRLWKDAGSRRKKKVEIDVFKRREGRTPQVIDRGFVILNWQGGSFRRIRVTGRGNGKLGEEKGRGSSPFLFEILDTSHESGYELVQGGEDPTALSQGSIKDV